MERIPNRKGLRSACRIAFSELTSEDDLVTCKAQATNFNLRNTLKYKVISFIRSKTMWAGVLALYAFILHQAYL
jgi:hypothetical protein